MIDQKQAELILKLANNAKPVSKTNLIAAAQYFKQKNQENVADFLEELAESMH